LTFQWPFVLVALGLVPVLAAAHVLRERRRSRYAARFVSPALLPNLVDASPGFRRHLPLAILLAGLAALIVGLARPHASVKVRREEATVVVAIDISRSMAATDVKPSRLGSAERAASAFLDRVPPTFRVGVVSFATRAVAALHPTTDRRLAHSVLVALQVGEGTALGDAVALSVRIGRQRTPDGVVPPAAVLVISDGKGTSGRTTVIAAAERARQAHVPVYTAAVGTANGVVQRTLTGGYHELVRVPADPESLQQIAEATGGEFFDAPSDPRLQDVFRRLGSRLGHTSVRRELTDMFAGGSALLLLCGGGLSAFWFRRVP
jgi:Ca-activated chloride channel family protein